MLRVITTIPRSPVATERSARGNDGSTTSPHPPRKAARVNAATATLRADICASIREGWAAPAPLQVVTAITVPTADSAPLKPLSFSRQFPNVGNGCALGPVAVA